MSDATTSDAVLLHCLIDTLKNELDRLEGELGVTEKQLAKQTMVLSNAVIALNEIAFGDSDRGWLMARQVLGDPIALPHYARLSK